MAHLIVLKTNLSPRVFWNISANVGPGCPNHPDDVQLVQLGLHCRGLINVAGSQLSPQDSALFQSVIPGAPYQGAANDPVTLAIRRLQAIRGGTQDGHVSVIAGTGIYDGQHTHMQIALSNSIAYHMRQIGNSVFPRIDRHPKCPGQLAGIAVAATEP